MKIYCGDPLHSGPYVFVSVEGDKPHPLRHYVKHSPDGFAWGYGGSGPSELARCILIDHMGEQAQCGGCDGTGKVARPKTADHILTDSEAWAYCSVCGGEGVTVAPGLYQDFKAEFVASVAMDEKLRITSAEIDDWLVAQGVSA